MRINTKRFGEIEVNDEKTIFFENGIIGFPELKHFMLIHDADEGSDVALRFLQSIEEPAFAMPVIDPFVVKPDYSPELDDDLLASAGDLTEDNTLVLVTITVPSDLTKMSVNLQGPFVINIEERKACQIIVEGASYPVKFPVYDILQARKRGE